MRISVCLTLLISFLYFFSISDAKADIGSANADLASLMIMHEGRVKPIETVAINYYKWFKEERNTSINDAVLWFQESIFDPEKAAEKPIFYVENTWLRDQLRSKKNKQQNDFSLIEIDHFFSQNKQDWKALFVQEGEERSKEQQAIEMLFEKKTAYSELLQSLSLFIPIPMVAQAEDISFFDFYDQKERYSKNLKEIMAEKGSDVSLYTEEESRIALTSYQMDMLTMGGRQHKIFKVLALPSGKWMSPWAFLLSEEADKSLLRRWQSAVHAYQNEDHLLFSEVLSDIKTQQQRLDLVKSYQVQVKSEQFYNLVTPFYWAFLIYLTVLVIALIEKIYPKEYMSKIIYGLVCFGGVLHATGLILRCLILERPPVSTLYESILFVSFISIVSSVFFMFKFKSRFYILVTVFISFFLLLISDFFLSDKDSLRVLVAVLNTNFWLATHVIMITIGYGLCLICACLAHGWLFLPAFSKSAVKEKRKTLFKHTYFMGLLALLFTLIGTILGGVWADQSWGRFWGWDPKENGALLIILWILWVLHGHVSSLLSRYWVMLGFSALTLVVALSWFGVNLLNIGLHSYGFISGLSLGLTAFCIVQIGFFLLTYRYKEIA